MAQLLPDEGVFVEERFLRDILCAVPRSILAAKAAIAHVEVAQNFTAYVRWYHPDNDQAQRDADAVFKLLNDDGQGVSAKNTAVGYRFNQAARVFADMAKLPADLLNVSPAVPVDMPARFTPQFAESQLQPRERPKPTGNHVQDMIADLLHLQDVAYAVRAYVEAPLEANARNIYGITTKMKYDRLRGQLIDLLADAVKRAKQAANIIQKYANAADAPAVNVMMMEMENVARQMEPDNNQVQMPKRAVRLSEIPVKLKPHIKLTDF